MKPKKIINRTNYRILPIILFDGKPGYELQKQIKILFWKIWIPARKQKRNYIGYDLNTKHIETTDKCYRSCSFFGSSMDGMECRHPYWRDKGAYDNMIITQDNSRNGNVPEKCPLKNKK